MPLSRPPMSTNRAEHAPAQIGVEPRSFQPAMTSRQMEILSWVAAGKSNPDIGDILGISGRTVEDHMKKIYGRLGVNSRIQAVVLVKEMGLQLPSTI